MALVLEEVSQCVINIKCSHTSSYASVHLSLTVDSDLLVNELYLATITAINAGGEKNSSVTVEFSKTF